MKNLFLLFLTLIVISSCDNSWYANGHVDEKFPGIFIVNDSIKVENKEMLFAIKNNQTTVFIRYDILINDKPFENNKVYIEAPKTKKEVIDIVEEHYKLYFKQKGKESKETKSESTDLKIV